MSILVVIDHPDQASFTHAVAEAFERGAVEAGLTCVQADLHAEGFDPRWTLADQAGTISPDVLAEQRRIEQAEIICLVFPLFWYGMPAMMKGWVDRVFTYGWAYNQIEDPHQSLLPSRKGVLLVPSGGRPDHWARYGLDSAMTTILREGTLGYFGLSDSDVHFLNGSEGSPERRAGLLERAYQAGRAFE